MENGKNHINQFSALDIERYHKGKLSAAEMHAMEKAAMDDPFLADAMEGYALAGDHLASDVIDLKQRLEKRTADTKLIPLGSRRNRNFNLLRAAVILVFVAGAALLIYQFGFNNNKKEIAEAKPVGKKLPVTTDTQAATGNLNIPASSDSDNKAVASIPADQAAVHKTTVPAGKTTAPVTVTAEQPAPVSSERGLDILNDADQEKNTAPKTTSVPRTADEKIATSRPDPKKEMKNRQEAEAQRNDKEEEYYARQQAMNQPAGAGRRDIQMQQFNTFRGRVTDSENRGVPFANVSNITDNNAGTYTDSKGYFNLTYPDSVLNVQVRSIGFENTNVQLKNNVSTNQVILKDDRTNMNEVVLSRQTNTAQRKAYDNMQVEEPEPVDGWVKYDAYLLNNVHIPKETDIPSGSVEISFEVNKNGEPTNIKVEKSLCSSCDKEALRLIKEGPKWKRNAKKGRTTVKVPF